MRAHTRAARRRNDDELARARRRCESLRPALFCTGSSATRPPPSSKHSTVNFRWPPSAVGCLEKQRLKARTRQIWSFRVLAASTSASRLSAVGHLREKSGVSRRLMRSVCKQKTQQVASFFVGYRAREARLRTQKAARDRSPHLRIVRSLVSSMRTGLTIWR